MFAERMRFYVSTGKYSASCKGQAACSDACAVCAKNRTGFAMRDSGPSFLAWPCIREICPVCSGFRCGSPFFGYVGGDPRRINWVSFSLTDRCAGAIYCLTLSRRGNSMVFVGIKSGAGPPGICADCRISAADYDRCGTGLY